jgi:hypothetical protein
MAVLTIAFAKAVSDLYALKWLHLSVSYSHRMIESRKFITYFK